LDDAKRSETLTQNISTLANSQAAGGKGFHIKWLDEQGFRTPATIVVGPQATDLHANLATFVDPQSRYVVRSSAEHEDAADESFAGQFVSIPDVVGVGALAKAVETVRTSGADSSAGSMFVLIQPEIEAVASGVLFSRNPLTGLDEQVVEATLGTSTGILAEGKTPDRWVWKWGEFIETPEQTLIKTTLIENVISDGTIIAEAWGSPVDLEWVFDGDSIWWVQLRPIGGVDLPVFSNRISREVLPGAIKPLVWSINVPLVNRQWIRLFDEAIGPTGLEPFDLSRQFGGHAYFNMAAIGDIFVQTGMPRDALENLLHLPSGEDSPRMAPTAKTFRLLPLLTPFAFRTVRSWGRSSELLEAGPDMLTRYESTDLNSVDLETHCSALDRDLQDITRFNVIVPLLMNLWNQLLRKVTGVGPIELPPHVQQELEQYTPAKALAALAAADEADRENLTDDLIATFGYLSDSGNDLSVPTWAEQPDMMQSFADAAPAEAAHGQQPTLDDVLASISWWKRPIARWVAGKAAAYQVRREAVSALYTKSYGLYRPLALEAGRRLADTGSIDNIDDVFYLDRSEAFGVAQPFQDLVHQRRSAMENAHLLDLPDIIIGDDYEPRLRRPPEARILVGTGTSRGRATGPARVVLSSDQIHDIHPGDVLIVPFSDVGWTPLFSQVGAVVSESGGMLSHTSIIARERAVPCVVSVSQACSIPNGTLLTVDGDAGDVTIEDAATPDF